MNFKRNKMLLLVFITLFAVGKPIFSYDYDPMTFTVTAEYIKPLTINFIDNEINLGTYMTGITLVNILNKSYDIEVGGSPGESIKISTTSTFNLTNARGDKIVIDQAITNPNVTVGSNGSVKSKINFTSLSTILSDGIYSGVTTITAESN